MGMEVDTDSFTTEEDDSFRTQRPGFAFRLAIEFFVKIRHGSRTFATSSFTLEFETFGAVQCKCSCS
jgi:hypothetical protein